MIYKYIYFWNTVYINNSRTAVVSDVVLSVSAWCCSGENECEYLNWALAGCWLVFFRPEHLATELKACWHMKLHHYTIYYSKSQLPLNTSLEPRWSYIIWWRAAMAANPGLSFIPGLAWTGREQFGIILGGSSGQNSIRENIPEVKSFESLLY